jgi:hypothetical protein
LKLSFAKAGPELNRFCLLLFLPCLAMLPHATRADTGSPEVLFTQVVKAIAPDGNPYPAVDIDPDLLPDLKSHYFELGRNCELVVKTNFADAAERGLAELAATIRRCCIYLEENTGGYFQRSILLYLIEFKEVPLSYRFTAAFGADCPWSEVRLAVLARGQPLYGNRMGRQLEELIFDTLPHELGHEILTDFGLERALQTGTDGVGARWFSEGVCEILAKGFCRSERPELWRHYVRQRNVGTILDQRAVRENLYRWSMASDLSAALESDLYGAAFLAMKVWTQAKSLPVLLRSLATQKEYLTPHGLLQNLQADTGLSLTDVLEQAHRSGVELAAISAATSHPRNDAAVDRNQLAPR